MYQVTENDIQRLGNNVKQYYIKLELLNSDFQVIDILSGECLSCSYTCDATSNIRRSCTVSLYIKNKSYAFDSKSKFWFNRFVKVYVGISTNLFPQIKYYPLGLYTYSEDNITWDSSNRALELKLVDFMWYLVQTKLGGADTTKVPAGKNIRDVLVSILSDLGSVKKYNVCNVTNIEDSSDNTIPYDISVEAGTTVYDLLNKVLNLYTGYECFFDMDTCIIRKIPNFIDDPIVLDADTIDKQHLVLGESIKIDFSNVFNVTEVFGETFDVDYYTDTSIKSGAFYSCTIGALNELYDDLEIAVKLCAPNDASPSLTINNLGTYKILDADGSELAANAINGYTVFKYQNEKFYVLGNYQVHAVCILRSTEPTDIEKRADIAKYNSAEVVYRVIPNSPFSIEKIGILKNVKYGSDYDNISSTTLCAQRAKYENWKSTRLQYILELQTQYIPFADVNQKFIYNILSTQEQKTFITTKVSSDNIVKGTMTIEANQFYETYPNGTSY